MGLFSGDAYRFDPEAFEQLTKGINAATAELKELGFDIEAELGRGFDKLSLDSVECGDDELAATLDSFCERWGWGVRKLMQDANEFSKKLGLTAGMYHEEEQYVSTTLKIGVNAAMGDPSLAPEEIKKKSWGQIGADNPFTQIRDADWDPTSPESLQAHQEAYEAVSQAKDDVTSIPDRIKNGDDADTKSTLGEVKPSRAHGGDDK
ncbi:hypothetical protein FCH28_22520 [Streptomyces piniterrae]|uniref:Uncharacterized protein n=1 Tax=Streptomyces piniterrae TaxID=2571125 RepID=A0A4U0N8C1_9ACTN|nr:hypothetical protein [Streptomyces piniterrae]TJZ50099.1 hypothetical protein FCH28_22520 [Streptomyces piniterrae]